MRLMLDLSPEQSHAVCSLAQQFGMAPAELILAAAFECLSQGDGADGEEFRQDIQCARLIVAAGKTWVYGYGDDVALALVPLRGRSKPAEPPSQAAGRN